MWHPHLVGKRLFFVFYERECFLHAIFKRECEHCFPDRERQRLCVAALHCFALCDAVSLRDRQRNLVTLRNGVTLWLTFGDEQHHCKRLRVRKRLRFVLPLAHWLCNAIPFALAQRERYSRTFRQRLRYPLRALSEHLPLCLSQQVRAHAQRLGLSQLHRPHELQRQWHW